MGKTNFEDNQALNDLFGSFKTIDEKIEEEKENEPPQINDIIETEEEHKEDIETKEKRTHKNIKSDKKSIIFSEVDPVVVEYLKLKTIVMGETKKEILNKIFKEEIKAVFNLPSNATETEMMKAISKRTKQISSMKNLFKN